CVVVANHPFGGIEGLALMSLVLRVRPDAKTLVNQLLGLIPPLREHLLLVDVLGGGAKANTMSMRATLSHLRHGGLLAVFPAGEVSHARLTRPFVADPPWSDTIARMAKRSGAPIVPVRFAGHNGVAFQLAGLVHPRLRTVMLPQEVVNKNHVRLQVAIGHPIRKKDADALEEYTNRLFPEEHTSREYFRYRSMVHELKQGSDASEHFLKAALTKDLSPKAKAAVASLLAKQCDRNREFPQAFAYAAQSGQALLKMHPSVDQLALADRIIEASQHSEVQEHAGDARPVFVVGMPRSGTTLLESMFMAHPQADGVGESPDPVAMIELACHRLRCSLPELHHKLDASLLLDFANEQLPRLHAAGAKGDRIVNKSLWLDRYVGILAAMFPGARFIWIHRDPRDNLLSCFLHYIGAPQATTVPELIKSRLAHEKLMRHWQSRYPGRVLEVGYESLVSNFDREVKRLLEFLDLPYHEDCLHFYQSDRLAMTPSRDQVRQPINRNAVDRWKNYEPFWSEVLEAFPAGRVSIPN
ncbi:MAG: sulfotransferase, partial [Phycisphaerales bacterium]